MRPDSATPCGCTSLQRSFRALPVGLFPAERSQLQQGLGGQGISAGGGIILQVLGAHQHRLRLRRRIEESALRVTEALQHLSGQGIGLLVPARVEIGLV